MTPERYWELVILAAPTLGLVTDIAWQQTRYRFSWAGTAWRSMFEGIAVGAVSCVLVTVLACVQLAQTRVEMLGVGLLALASFLALAFGYFSFVNLNYTSLRVRLLRELRGAGGRLAVSSLMQRYSADRVIEHRLARLRDAGQLVHHKDRFQVGDARWFLLLGSVLRALRRVLLGRVSSGAPGAVSSERMGDRSPD